ncbi:unnamed protein product [Candida verbasci]|uniref:Autophagy-related protein 21 n=1 Tax=Candida verbasci TaxID=1227364 RepID=A0A9W4XKX9_9ASCO|nr:unnamed protein product [Candida verbasci]
MINNLNFSPDYTSLCLSSDSYYRIYNCEPFGQLLNIDSSALILKMLFSTSLTILVQESNKLIIQNLKQNLKICDLEFDSKIIDIKLNRKRLLVVLESSIHIYDLISIQLIKILELKSKFIGDLSESWLVVPSNLLDDDENGYVIIYDIIKLEVVLRFKAHNSKIEKLSISKNQIATASIKGTIIRVFHLNDDQIDKVSNLRRGHNPAKITTLSFHLDNHILGCASESNTVHLFNLTDEITTNENESDDSNEMKKLILSKPIESKASISWLKKTKKLINTSYKKLPYKEYLNNLIWEPPRRSFAYIKLPEYEKEKPRIEIGFNRDIIFIASYNSGKFYQYQLPKKTNDSDREECLLINQYNLI